MEHEVNDRPALSSLLQFAEKRFHVNEETPENGLHGLKLKGLPFPEQYLKRHLRFALIYRDTFRKGDGRYAVCYKCDSGNAASVTHHHALDVSGLGYRQQNHMFVSDIEPMQVHEHLPSPTLVGLNFITDEIPDCFTRTASSFDMSIDGTTEVIPRAFHMNWEVDPIANLMAVVCHQNAVRVIQGGPEIVQSITHNGGRMPCEDTSDAAEAIPNIRIILGEQSLHICRPKPPENRFELLDVMFSPFGL